MAILQFESAYQGGVKPLTISDEEKAAIQRAFTQTPSLLQLLSTVRSRRFGMGYRYESGQSEVMTWGKGKTVVQEKGPTGYVSKMQPHPVSELEEAIIAWAACGPNGVMASSSSERGCGCILETYPVGPFSWTTVLPLPQVITSDCPDS